jgi:hypothetical protein
MRISSTAKRLNSTAQGFSPGLRKPGSALEVAADPEFIEVLLVNSTVATDLGCS